MNRKVNYFLKILMKKFIFKLNGFKIIFVSFNETNIVYK